MKKTSFKPSATVILQMLAHQEVECVEHEGKLFVHYPTPTISVSGKDVVADEPAPPKKSSTKEETPEAEVPTKKAKEAKIYSEDDLKDMETKELSTILEDMGIDPNDTDGKNTHKKLRLLILDNQEEPGEESEEEEEASSDTPEASGDVEAILIKLDEGEIAEAKAVKELMELSDDGDKKVIAKIIDRFMEEADTPIEDFVSELSEELGLTSTKEAPTKKPKKSTEKVVEVSELEEGDKVKVFWEEFEEHYTGEVTKIRRGKVTVKYDEDNEEVDINPKEHTEIILLG